MKMFLVPTVLLFLVSEVWTQDCDFNPPSNSSPYIIDENYNFPSTLHFGPEELFYIACPKGTASPYLAEDGDRVVCKGDTSILNTRTIEVLDFKNIECKSNVFLTSVQNSNETCGSNSTMLDVGYKVYQGFVPVISVCFNQVKLAPFYAKFKNMFLDSKSMTAGSNYVYILDLDLVCLSESGNCDFVDSGGLFSDVNIDNIYANQNQIFQNLGVDVNDSLVKFPLAVNTFISFPQHVEIYPFWDYINVVPMWSIPYDLWDTVRTWYRSYAGDFLYIGTLGVATMPDSVGNLVELYLSNNQIPVPKWIWMVIESYYTSESGVAVIFTYNSVFELKDYADVCKDVWEYLATNVILCDAESVTDPEIKTFLANTVCKNTDCQIKG